MITTLEANVKSALAPFMKSVPVISDREQASHFHNLAMMYVHNAVVRRRWMKAVAATNQGADGFFGDIWTPERAALVRQYRDLARAFRATARGQVVGMA